MTERGPVLADGWIIRHYEGAGWWIAHDPSPLFTRRYLSASGELIASNHANTQDFYHASQEAAEEALALHLLRQSAGVES